MEYKVELSKKALNRWSTPKKEVHPEGILERCTIETMQAVVKEFDNVVVKTVQIETNNVEWPDVCHVVLEETAPGGKPVTINVWAPLNWNGRFLGCVGGGTRTFHLYNIMGEQYRIATPLNALQNGFATANTDGGVPGDVLYWGLDEKTKAVDYELILNLAYRSTHSMTVIAKAIVTAIYGIAPQYSYMQGASGGGRQALTEAQLYPEDYDGIWAVDPAINWTGLFTSFIWPLAVMNEEKHVITPAKLAFFRSVAIEKSGGTFDFIETADMPNFDPLEYVGQQASDGEITEADAIVMKLIFDGPKTRDGHFLWYGFRPGTKFWGSGLLGDSGGLPYYETENGFEPQLNSLGNGFVGAWLKRDMDWDWKKLGYREFEELYKQGLRDFSCLECNSPDLYDLKQHGTKVLLSHAVNDDTIPCDGTLDYYRHVLERMGGEEEVSNYFRLFMSPGGGHTDMWQPGLSFTLADGMIALMKWVEEGIAPETIPAVQYDFEQNAVVLTGDVSVYRLGKENRGMNIQITDAYGKSDVKEKNEKIATTRFHAGSSMADIMEDGQGLAILRKYIGALLDNPMITQARGMTIGAIKDMMPVQHMKEKISKAISKLEEL